MNKHTTRTRRPTLSVLPFLGIVVAAVTLGVGCVDNSGGPPPDGTELEEFTPVSFDAGGLFCGSGGDAGFLIHDATEAQAFLDDSCEGHDAAAGQELVDAAGTLEDTEAIVILTIQLGGCLGEYGVLGFYLSDDDTTVTGWVLRGDSAYGRQNVACTADWGMATEVYRVMGAADAVQAEILVGPFNPDLPGAPALPGG